MRIHSVALLLAAFIAGCASEPVPFEVSLSLYDRGVAAYRAQNYVAARGYWAQAADRGSAAALNNLGTLLFDGLGGEAEPSRAVALWLQASMRGFPEAQWLLGRAFQIGKGVTQDKIEAYAWYRCAIEGAQVPTDKWQALQNKVAESARLSLASVTGQLTLDELKPAEERAKRYIQSYAMRKRGA